jgi:hypothetical protein
MEAPVERARGTAVSLRAFGVRATERPLVRLKAHLVREVEVLFRYALSGL